MESISTVEEYKLQISENKVLQKILELKENKVGSNCTILCDSTFHAHNIYTGVVSLR
jgi:hypothetical protein